MDPRKLTATASTETLLGILELQYTILSELLALDRETIRNRSGDDDQSFDMHAASYLEEAINPVVDELMSRGVTASSASDSLRVARERALNEFKQLVQAAEERIGYKLDLEIPGMDFSEPVTDYEKFKNDYFTDLNELIGETDKLRDIVKSGGLADLPPPPARILELVRGPLARAQSAIEADSNLLESIRSDEMRPRAEEAFEFYAMMTMLSKMMDAGAGAELTLDLDEDPTLLYVATAGDTIILEGREFVLEEANDKVYLSSKKTEDELARGGLDGYEYVHVRDSDNIAVHDVQELVGMIQQDAYEIS